MSLVDSIKHRIRGFRKIEPLVADGRSYYVKVPEKTDLNMVWGSRQAARQYKKFLRENSLMSLNPEIWEVIFEDGLQIQERKIS